MCIHRANVSINPELSDTHSGPDYRPAWRPVRQLSLGGQLPPSLIGSVPPVQSALTHCDHFPDQIKPAAIEVTSVLNGSAFESSPSNALNEAG